ncbi:MAG: hypothetical protein M4579_001334 [Chaenotheca gracillima]|nr:MAG: hypothetical protein M4579_001334 [Chaenotheca gracillima]
MAPYDLFYLLGDSLIQQSNDQEKGFAFTPALQNAYIRRLDVVNRGFNGYTTAHMIKILPQIIPSPQEAKIRLMLILLGANDSSLPGVEGGQHVPLDQFRDLLISIATHPSVKAHDARVMLVTPPPTDERPREASDVEKGVSGVRRTAANTSLYAEEVRKIGKELDLPVVDLWSAFMQMAGWKEGEVLLGSKEKDQNPVLEELMHDGLHLNPQGYRILYREVINTIERVWPDQACESLPMIFPTWDVAPR